MQFIRKRLSLAWKAFRYGEIPNSAYPSKFKGFEPYSISSELKKKIDLLDIEFIFSEFGEGRENAGGSDFSAIGRLDPSFSCLKKYFPKARFTLYSDVDVQEKGVELQRVKSPIPHPEHPRYLYRTADYFKFVGLSRSKADIAIVMDTDMWITGERIYHLIALIQKFGYVVPDNPRSLLNLDMEISLDTRPISDASGAMGRSYNQSPMGLSKSSDQGRLYFSRCAEELLKNPSRASRAMWQASWDTGFYPYVLPPQFCVCIGQEGIGKEALLHIGHPSVAQYYQIKF